MALQGYDIEVRYAQNTRLALGQGLSDCQHCQGDGQPEPQSLPQASVTPPSDHHYYDENVCEGLPRVYVDGRSFHHESQLRAGVGMVWSGQNATGPNHFQLGPKSSQYAEVAAVLIELQHAVNLGIKQFVGDPIECYVPNDLSGKW